MGMSPLGAKKRLWLPLDAVLDSEKDLLLDVLARVLTAKQPLQKLCDIF